MFAAYSTEEEIRFQCKEFIIHPSQLLPARLKLLSCRSSEKIVVVSCEIKLTNTTPYKKVSESVIKYELNGDLYLDYTKNYYSILICYFFKNKSSIETVRLTQTSPLVILTDEVRDLLF